ncbi:MAG: hypothetical protein IJX45_09975, partial [Spirochaetaceae bacterium]|nr:hypothetical protein [Spirochaetaceae bacterium]
MDRDNRSLDKVKKYIGIQKDDLDQKFNEQISRLKSEYNEVEVRQTQAIATVRNLNDKIGEFDQLTKEFDNRIQAVDTIDSKITAYDKTLQQLVDMTADLEENMRRVGAETAVVDKLEKQMGLYQKNVHTLEGRISKLTADFAEKNGEQLKQMGKELLNRFNEKVQQLEISTEESLEKNQQVLQHINDSVADIYSNAAQKAQSLEDQSFLQLQNRTQENITQLQHAFDEALEKLNDDTSIRVENLQEYLTSQVANLRGELDERTASLEQLSSQLAEETSGNSRTLASVQQSIMSRAQELEEQYREAYDRAMEEIALQESQALDSFSALSIQNRESLQSDIQYQLDQLQQRLEEAIENTRQNTLERLDSVEGEFSSRISQAEESINSRATQAQQLADQVSILAGENSSSLDSVQADLTRRIEDLRQEYLSAYQNALDSIEDKERQVLAELEECSRQDTDRLQQDMESLVAQVRSQLENDIARTQNDSQTRLESIQTSIQQGIASLENDSQDQLEGIRSTIQQDIARLDSDSRSQLEGIQSLVQQEISNFQEGFENRLSSVEANLEQRTSQTEEALRQMEEVAQQNISQVALLSQENQNRMQELEDQYHGLYQAAMEAARQKERDSFEEFESFVRQEISSMREDALSQLTALKDDIQQNMDSVN